MAPICPYANMSQIARKHNSWRNIVDKPFISDPCGLQQYTWFAIDGSYHLIHPSSTWLRKRTGCWKCWTRKQWISTVSAVGKAAPRVLHTPLLVAHHCDAIYVSLSIIALCRILNFKWYFGLVKVHGTLKKSTNFCRCERFNVLTQLFVASWRNQRIN